MRGRPLNGDNIIGAFSEADAARLSTLTVGQLRRWDRKGFVQPSYAETDRSLPYSRIYSFRDIVALRVLGQLRNVHKVPLQHLRKVSDMLAHLGDSKWTATTLYVLGKRVVFTDPRYDQRIEIVSGQQVFDIPLQVVISDTRKAIENLNHRSFGAMGKVVHGKFTLQNEPVFEGTRIPVATVKRYLDANYSPEAIMREFPDLTPADIETARSSDKGQSAA
jgi:DNA-binding transcriptional MerR regulator